MWNSVFILLETFSENGVEFSFLIYHENFRKQRLVEMVEFSFSILENKKTILEIFGKLLKSVSNLHRSSENRKFSFSRKTFENRMNQSTKRVF